VVDVTIRVFLEVLVDLMVDVTVLLRLTVVKLRLSDVWMHVEVYMLVVVVRRVCTKRVVTVVGTTNVLMR
jgi:hypothetical protein